LGYPAYGVSPYNPNGTPTNQQELDSLKGHAENLEATLKDINERIAELEAQAKKK
jgi:hypothetical protein